MAMFVWTRKLIQRLSFKSKKTLVLLLIRTHGKLLKTFQFDASDPIVEQVCSKGGMLDLLIVVPHDEFNFAVAYSKKFLVLPQPGQTDILDRSSCTSKELWAR